MNRHTTNSRAGLLCLALSFSIFLPFGNTLLAQSYGALWSVVCEAEVSDDPVQLTLNWNAVQDVIEYSIYRRVAGTVPWGSKLNSDALEPTTTQYIDNGVTTNINYEYRILAKRSNYPTFATGYLSTGINLTATESRGTIALIIDDTFIDDLSTELNQLVFDLIGDGWQVIRILADRDETPVSVKAKIVAAHTANPSLSSLYLIGHVPVPYSGSFAPDQHSDHIGAWPADVYYGDMDGTWTDATINNSTASDSRNHNTPGDGKFDQSTLPSDVDLEVGRIDFANLSLHTEMTELELLQQYLNKAHQFKHGEIDTQKQALIDDNFPTFTEGLSGMAWRSFGGLVGKDNFQEEDYFDGTTTDSYLMGYASGGGTYSSLNGVGSSSDFIEEEVDCIFNFFLGSYMGDWDSENNLMRMALTSGNVLTSVWSGRPHWQPQGMAMGGTIGECTMLSQNHTSSTGYYPSGGNTRNVHIALMGDPSLRLHQVLPPTELVASYESEEIDLTWTPAPGENYVGFNIYRSDEAEGPFNKINEEIISDYSFTDDELSAETHYYMIRGIKLQESPSGTYLNLSQGIFTSAISSSVPLPVELLSFSAELNDSDEVSLKWSTAIEQNVSHFEVQKSRNGVSWIALGNIAATGNSITKQQYAFIDTKALSGNNYYRLKIIDEDQSFEVSAIEVIEYENAFALEVNIYPNPVKSQLQLKFSQFERLTQKISIQLIDSRGALIYENQNIDPAEISYLPISNLSNGAYFLKIQDGEHTIVHQFVKQ